MRRASGPQAAGSTDVAIVADDLTGALDTAGSFASPEYPVHVVLKPPVPHLARIALDADSRDLPERAAVARVADAFAAQRDTRTGLTFKKIDSVMRGHPIAEAVAAFRAGGFDRALLAPAFPAMGRITTGGQQYVMGSSGRTAAGPQLVEALRARGVPAAMLGDGGEGRGFLVADAETQAELVVAVEAFGNAGRTLHVGTAGLAAALAGDARAPGAVPPIDLAICGTLHPVTRRQVRALDAGSVELRHMDGGDWPMPAGPAVFVAPDEVEGGLASVLIEGGLRRLVAERAKPGAALVTGGWTLRLLSRICGADRLACIGLFAAGIPICRMAGGLWDGATIVSKSGGFGGDRLLSDLFAGRPAPELG
jgi:D-threonate/D-erythronate kinase